MCTNLKRINGRVCSCGRCAECVAKKSNAVMQVLTDAAKKYGSVQFLTLTYRNDSVPLFIRPTEYDVDFTYNVDSEGNIQSDMYEHTGFRTVTGEDIYTTNLDSYYKSVRGERPDPEQEEKLREEYFKDYHYDSHKKHGDKLVSKTMSIDDVEYYVTPSLDREDVKKWLKRCRINYKRRVGESLPTFKYYILGEYGPQTNRPHYHCLFFGLSHTQIAFFQSDWQSYYGNTVLEGVKGTEGDYQRCTSYVAKYINKGVFEPRCSKQQLVQKPRQMSSLGIIELPQKDLDWYQGKDLGVDVMDQQIDKKIIARLVERQFRTVNKFKYSLSEKYKNKYFKYEYEEIIPRWNTAKHQMEVITKKHRVNTPLQDQISHYVQMRINDVYNEQLEAYLHNFGEVVEFGSDAYFDAVDDFTRYQKALIEDRRRCSLRKLQQTVAKSRF